MFCEVFSPGPCSPPARKLARFARCGRFAPAGPPEWATRGCITVFYMGVPPDKGPMETVNETLPYIYIYIYIPLNRLAAVETDKNLVAAVADAAVVAAAAAAVAAAAATDAASTAAAAAAAVAASAAAAVVAAAVAAV